MRKLIYYKCFELIDDKLLTKREVIKSRALSLWD